MAKDLFISHSKEDAEIAQEVCMLFEQRGIKCWIAPRDVSPGKSYGEEIIDAIQSVQAAVLILSEHSNKSTYVRNEIERAVSYGKTIFTIRIRNVAVSRKLELFISSSQWVDAWDPPMSQIIARLANTIHTLADESQKVPEDIASIEKKVFAITDQLRKQPFAATSFEGDLKLLAERINHHDLYEEESAYVAALIYRLYAGAIFMTPTNKDLANPLRKGLPWLQKSLELSPDFEDIKQLRIAKTFFASVLQEKADSAELKKFLLHQAIIVMVNASYDEVTRAVENGYKAITNMITPGR